MKNGLIIESNGTKYWHLNDHQYHRIDGPAVEYPSGTKCWYQNGERHRVDGPAIENADGTKIWYQNGELHRIDGPAIECPDGTKEWYVDGCRVKEENFERFVKEWLIRQVIES